MACERCGRELVIGDWPYCKGSPEDHVMSREWGWESFTPYDDMDVARYGKHFGNRGERVAYMNKHNIEYRDTSKHRGMGKRLFLDMKGR